MNLHEINQLIREFHSSAANNERKREIERQLIEIQRDGESWKFCLSGLSDPHEDDQIKLFFFHCLENVIHQNWFRLCAVDKKTIRDNLWAMYVRTAKDASRVQRNKLAQLIAIFGKRQFPTGEHEDYDKQIKALLEERSTFILGVILLRANCEEILNTRSDVTILTRESFSQAISKVLISIVPQVFDNALRVIIDRNNTATDTPEFLLFVSEIFPAIQAIIQCDIIEDSYLSNIVNDLFTIAKSDLRLAGLAMETLVELFARQRIFKVHDIVGRGIVELLRNCDKTNETTLIQLLQAASKHLTVEWWTKVSVCSLDNYLELLWGFTTKYEDPTSFCEKLTIWTPILNYYSEHVTMNFPECLFNVAKLSFNRVLLQYNSHLTDIYDHDTSEESEWATFLKTSLDVIAVVSQFQSAAVFDLICVEIAKPHGPLDTFANIVHKPHNTFMTTLNDTQNVPYLRLMLRDLGTQSQILARSLPGIKANVEDVQNLRRLDEIITKVIEVAHLLLAQIAQISAPYALNLFEDLIFTEAQLFNSIIYLFSISTTITSNQGIIVDVFDNAVQFILRAINEKNDTYFTQVDILLVALAEFLKGIIVEFRPKVLMDEGKSINALMACDLSGRPFPQNAAQILYRTIFSCLLLPWRNCTQQEQPRRIDLAGNYVRHIGRRILLFETDITLVDLEIFEDILIFFCNENSFAKQILVQSLRPLTEKTFCIFKTFQFDDVRVLERVLRFFHCLLRTLQTQLTVDVIKELILAFIEHCKKTSNAMVLNYLLKIFLNIVKQHTHSSFVLLPDIVKLSIEEAAPLLFTNPTDESVLHLYAVFDAILQERWQFFFKSQVLRGFSPFASDDATIAMDFEPHHAEYISFILNAYGHALNLHANLDLTRLVLESLVHVDDKHKLFQTLYFQKNFLAAYQTAIIQCLGAPEGIINFDLLISVLYKMSYKQMGTLISIFCELYEAARGGVNGVNVHLEGDLPTFAFQISNLVHDLRLGTTQNSKFA